MIIGYFLASCPRCTMAGSAAAESVAVKTFQIVVAATKKMGIGQGGTMPWKLPGDMQYFRELTTKTQDGGKRNAVVMGRKTWESIPLKFRPLKGRINIVLTRGSSDSENSSSVLNCTASGVSKLEGVHTSNSLENAMALLASPEFQSKVENVFVIGGGQVYKEAISSPLCSAIHLTEVIHRV